MLQPLPVGLYSPTQGEGSKLSLCKAHHATGVTASTCFVLLNIGDGLLGLLAFEESLLLGALRNPSGRSNRSSFNTGNPL